MADPRPQGAGTRGAVKKGSGRKGVSGTFDKIERTILIVALCAAALIGSFLGVQYFAKM